MVNAYTVSLFVYHYMYYDIAAFMLILTLVPFLTCIHAAIGIFVVLISALLGIIMIGIVVIVTVAVAFVVVKRRSGKHA